MGRELSLKALVNTPVPFLFEKNLVGNKAKTLIFKIL